MSSKRARRIKGKAAIQSDKKSQPTEKPPREYSVTWQIDISATSAREAAEKAQTIMRDPQSTATIFEVEEFGTYKSERVDLLEPQGFKTGNQPYAPKTDFSIRYEDSISLLFPLTQSAKYWIEENIFDDAQYFDGAVVIERQYVKAIVDGIRNDGLTIA